MLRYTGHPLFDIGVAAVTAFSGKRHPELVAESDLDRVADYIERNYVIDPLKSFLNVAFPNSGFTNPAFESAPHRRVEYARRLSSARASSADPQGQKCVFTGEPASDVALSDKIPPGRAFRQHIPLITGEGVINFYPWGDAGLPISGKALLCIQFFPMGCAKCGGKLLAVHSDNPDLTYEFAAEFLEQNRAAVMLAQQAGEKKMPEASASAKTLLIRTFLDIERKRLDLGQGSRPCSVTAYHLTNSGQSNPLDTNPPLEIYHLPLELTAFLSQLIGPEYKSLWQRIEDRAWQLDPTSATENSRRKSASGKTGPRRNFLYEDIFRLPEIAPTFIRRYFLRTPMRTSATNDPRAYYSIKDEADLVSWKIADLFLRKVMGMDKQRIERIRALGDSLAEYVSSENDRRFFTTFFREMKYDYFRNALIKANLAWIRGGHPPLIKLDPYVEIFEEGDEVARWDWRLARDLVLIRLVERLYELGWIGANRDAVTDEPVELEPVP